MTVQQATSIASRPFDYAISSLYTARQVLQRAGYPNLALRCSDAIKLRRQLMREAAKDGAIHTATY